MCLNLEGGNIGLSIVRALPLGIEGVKKMANMNGIIYFSPSSGVWQGERGPQIGRAEIYDVSCQGKLLVWKKQNKSYMLI